MRRTLPASLVATATVAALAVLPPSAARADPPTCHGKPATIVSSAQHVVGTAGDDVIVATGGYPTIRAGGGDDTVCAESLSATVHAGSGDDDVDTTSVPADSVAHVNLGRGSDTYQGGPAEDYVRTGSGGGHDVVSTGDNTDFVTIRSGRSTVSTGAGNDSVFMKVATSGHLDGGSLDLGSDQDLNYDKLYVLTPAAGVRADELHRSLRIDDAHYRLTGAEVIKARGRTVLVLGDEDADTFHVYGCRVTLAGRGGSDRLFLDAPSSAGRYDARVPCGSVRGHLSGGAGNDYLSAGSGRGNVLVGGPGRDQAFGGGRSTCDAERTSGCR